MIQKIFRLKFALLIILNTFAGALIYAADGDLDTTFDGDGVVITDNNNSTQDFLGAIAVQPDGKVVIAGTTRSSAYPDVIIIRYNLDGSPDSSFGTGGKTIIPAPFSYNRTTINAMAIAPDGKIVFAGSREILVFDSPTSDMYVGRLNANGTLDTSLNGTGTVSIDFPNQRSDNGYGVFVQSDGKIIISGRTYEYVAPTSNRDFAMVRLNQSGTVDFSFNGGNAYVINQITSRRFVVGTGEIALQPDGKIVVVGTAGVPNSTNVGLFTARFNADGTLDLTFDGDGIALSGQSGSDIYAGSAAITPDGKILAAGGLYLGNADYRGYFIQYNSDGSLDPTFGNGGTLLTSFDFINQIAIQADGKILATDGSGVLRLFSNGVVDNTFGGDGHTTIPAPGGSTSEVYTIGLDSTRRKIYVGGSARTSNDAYDFLTARLISELCTTNCAPPRNKVSDFDGDGKSDQAVFRPNGGVWHLLRSTNGFVTVQFGVNTDKISPADFDNDGKTDISVFRDGIWYWLESSTGTFRAVQFGQSGDIPVPADYRGDGRAELAVYRGGYWHTLNLADNQYQVVQFGLPTDKPVQADYDGDGKSDYAVYRDGTWYMLRSTAGILAAQFGQAGDTPAVGDYDGDGKSDLAVYRGGTWYILGSTRGFFGLQFGLSTDVPAPADYDGDGKTDFGVYRDGTWFLLRSNAGFGQVNFGLSGDKPIPAAFLQ